jgi:hypothetical protein
MDMVHSLIGIARRARAVRIATTSRDDEGDELHVTVRGVVEPRVASETEPT